MTPAEVRRRFRAVVARALRRAEREEREHLAALRRQRPPKLGWRKTGGTA
jgi:hypothetical protein